jgi:hypothetical protein
MTSLSRVWSVGGGGDDGEHVVTTNDDDDNDGGEAIVGTYNRGENDEDGTVVAIHNIFS